MAKFMLTLNKRKCRNKHTALTLILLPSTHWDFLLAETNRKSAARRGSVLSVKLLCCGREQGGGR